MFRKVLIANRGEIACRIALTCRRLGVRSVAVYSDADRRALHVEACDESVHIGPSPVRESYLDVGALVAAVQSTGADAVHPGYGLLSENPGFARAVADAGATFIGPPVSAMAELGDKLRARELARRVGVQPPPGTLDALESGDATACLVEAERLGYPVLVKAAAGGGGIGMQVVRDPGELTRSLESSASRARQAFGDDRVYLEKYLERPRHVEVQILADDHGNTVALGERECSVQRRHQKIVEESPCGAAFFAGEEGEAQRQALFQRALAIVRAGGYRGAGTVEFIVDAAGTPYFLEVNARLQVEHPVTELVTGLDLVEWQLRVASGEPFDSSVLTARSWGHAVEARLCAEDPGQRFVPQPGRIQRLVWPENVPGVRIDTGFREGDEVTPFYDSLLAKVIAHGATRTEALGRLHEALSRTEIELVGGKNQNRRATNRDLLRSVLVHPEFTAGEYDTHLLERLSGT